MDDCACQFETDILRSAYAYWRGLCGDAGMPLRRQIDPIDLCRLLREVHGRQWPRIEEDCHGVVRTEWPNFARRSGFTIGKDYVTYERILLPVSDIGDRVDAPVRCRPLLDEVIGQVPDWAASSLVGLLAHG